jgi:pimeloyl-ACP methyl ester carboxylesterase
MLDTRSVVVPDLLGFGRSPKPDTSAYDIDAHLAAIREYVPSGSTVVGHSVGAVLAAALAAREPELLAISFSSACRRIHQTQSHARRSVASGSWRD